MRYLYIGYNDWLSLKKWGQSAKVQNLPYPFLRGQPLNLFRFGLTKIGIDGLLFEFTPCMTLLCNQWRKENSTVFDKPSQKQKVWFSHLFIFSFSANRTERSKKFLTTVTCSVLKDNSVKILGTVGVLRMKNPCLMRTFTFSALLQ